MPRFNPYEFQARTIKVDALVRAVYATMRPSNAYEAGALVALLRGTSQQDRDMFARAAGQLSPSATTWSWVCDEILKAHGKAA